MKSTWRILTLLLILCLAFCTVACDNSNAQDHGRAMNETTVGSETETPTRPAEETPADPAQEELSDEELYARAVRDAVFIEEDEILPLVNISKDDKNVTWNETGDKVLVAFMNKYPGSYPAGETITLQWGNVWCVSEKEMCKWVKENGEGVEDWTARLHQSLGMPTTKGYTTVTALWIDADLLYRPANVTDPTAEMTTTYQATGDETFDAMYKAWFDSNIIWSYFDDAYPWTRLGYTYDWADNGTEYGMSEFLIFKGAAATVAYTYSVEEFIAYAQTAY